MIRCPKCYVTYSEIMRECPACKTERPYDPSRISYEKPGFSFACLWLVRAGVLLNLFGILAGGFVALIAESYWIAALLILLAAPATWGVFIALGVALERVGAR